MKRQERIEQLSAAVKVVLTGQPSPLIEGDVVHTLLGKDVAKLSAAADMANSQGHGDLADALEGIIDVATVVAVSLAVINAAVALAMEDKQREDPQ